MKARCLIVDDESLARKGIEEYIEKSPNLECVSSLGSPYKALAYLKENEVDILFLDIQMPDMTGLEFMKVLSNPPQVIFTTAHREFALDGFELNAVDYLLKPISYNRFLKAVQKTLAKNTQTTVQKEAIFIKCDGLIVKILCEEILFIETAKDYVFIQTLKKRYLTLISLRQIQENLPMSKFMKVHRSYVVGVQHVDKIEGNLLYIEHHKIKISRLLKSDVYNRIIGNRLIER